MILFAIRKHTSLVFIHRVGYYVCSIGISINLGTCILRDSELVKIEQVPTFRSHLSLRSFPRLFFRLFLPNNSAGSVDRIMRALQPARTVFRRRNRKSAHARATRNGHGIRSVCGNRYIRYK